MNLATLLKNGWENMPSFIDINIDGETVVKEVFNRPDNLDLKPYLDYEVKDYREGEFLIDEVWDVMEQKTIITLIKPEKANVEIFALGIYNHGKFAGILRDKIFFSLPKAEEYNYMKNNEVTTNYGTVYRVITLRGEVNAKLA